MAQSHDDNNHSEQHPIVGVGVARELTKGQMNQNGKEKSDMVDRNRGGGVTCK